MILRSVRQLAERRGEDIAQFVGYVAVSVAALVADISVYWGLLTVAKYAFVAAIGGYVSGVLLHYLLSSRIVFANRFHRRGIADRDRMVKMRVLELEAREALDRSMMERERAEKEAARARVEMQRAEKALRDAKSAKETEKRER